MKKLLIKIRSKIAAGFFPKNKEASNIDRAEKLNEMSFLNTVLRGGVENKRENTEFFLNQKLKFRYQYFIVLRINSDDYKNATPGNAEKLYDVYSDLIQNTVQSHVDFKNDSRITGVEGSFYMLLNFDVQIEDTLLTDRFIVDFAKRMEDAIEYLEETYSFNISIDISSVYKGVLNTSKAYSEVCNLAEYARIMDISYLCLTRYDAEFCQNEPDLLYLEMHLYISYRNALSKGQYSKAGDILNEIMNTYLSGSLPAMSEFRSSLISQLTLAYSCLESEDATFFTTENINQILTGNQVREIDTLVELQNKVVKTFEYLESRHIICINRVSIKIDDIHKYIETNYQNYNLNTTMICDAFEISPSYLFRLFRDSESSVLSYIHMVRLEEAKRLLRESCLTVDDISQKVGFSGRWTLIRLFKRYEGKTPAQYRAEKTKL